MGRQRDANGRVLTPVGGGFGDPHRRGLIRRAEQQGLFRDPERLVERMLELEDGLWRAVGITEIDMGVMVGRFPKARQS